MGIAKHEATSQLKKQRYQTNYHNRRMHEYVNSTLLLATDFNESLRKKDQL